MNKWGQPELCRWPSASPAWVIGVLLAAVMSSLVIQYYRYTRLWTPLQRFYFGDYARNLILAGFGIEAGTYQLLKITEPKGQRPVMDEDLLSAAASPPGSAGLALSPESLKRGAKLVYDSPGSYDNAQIGLYFSHWIYHDQTLFDLAQPALLGGLVVLASGLIIAIPKERQRVRLRRHGRRLKGPELIRAADFNGRNRPGGIAFTTDEQPGWLDRILRREYRSVRIPHEIENQHFLLMGDRGMGKSTLIRQILLQVAARRETAIVYDPALEYTPEFYNPERGDLILNPLDDRAPYWSPAEEVRHDAEAFSLAGSLYPDQPLKEPFFSRAPRAIFAHLLTLGLPAEELAWWMCHEEEITRPVEGTKLEAMIAPVAAEREYVLAELKAVGRVLRLLPSVKEGRMSWSSREWSRQRRGWLFLTSTSQTREWLLPLASFWLDLLVLRLMNQGMAGLPPVWLVVDDVTTLQKLPQLYTAMAEKRKSNNRIVLGLDNVSQLEKVYGKETASMLSQAATKIFLRTTDPDSANWISQTIGEVEIERLQENQTPWYSWHQENGLVEHQRHRLVMPSEIMELAPRHSYLKSGNLVVRLSLPQLNLPRKQPAFVERILERAIPASWTANVDSSPKQQAVERPKIKEAPVRRIPSGTTESQRPFFE